MLARATFRERLQVLGVGHGIVDTGQGQTRSQPCPTTRGRRGPQRQGPIEPACGPIFVARKRGASLEAPRREDGYRFDLRRGFQRRDRFHAAPNTRKKLAAKDSECGVRFQDAGLDFGQGGEGRLFATAHGCIDLDDSPGDFRMARGSRENSKQRVTRVLESAMDHQVVGGDQHLGNLPRA